MRRSSSDSIIRADLNQLDWDPWAIEGVNGQMYVARFHLSFNSDIPKKPTRIADFSNRCDPSSTGRYPDDKQPNLQFFKPDSYIASGDHEELKKREEHIRRRPLNRRAPTIVDGVDTAVYDTLLYKSVNPSADALYKLDKRAPSPPNCESISKHSSQRQGPQNYFSSSNLVWLRSRLLRVLLFNISRIMTDQTECRPRRFRL